jgi:hypothetical protein
MTKLNSLFRFLFDQAGLSREGAVAALIVLAALALTALMISCRRSFRPAQKAVIITGFVRMQHGTATFRRLATTAVLLIVMLAAYAYSHQFTSLFGYLRRMEVNGTSLQYALTALALAAGCAFFGGWVHSSTDERATFNDQLQARVDVHKGRPYRANLPIRRYLVRAAFVATLSLGAEWPMTVPSVTRSVVPFIALATCIISEWRAQSRTDTSSVMRAVNSSMLLRPCAILACMLDIALAPPSLWFCLVVGSIMAWIGFSVLIDLSVTKHRHPEPEE